MLKKTVNFFKGAEAIKPSAFMITGFFLLFTLPVFSQDTSHNIAEKLYDSGQESFSRGDTDKAISFYERSIEADPDFSPAYKALGEATIAANGQPNDIVWLFEQAAILDPKNPERYTDLCRVYFQSQKNDMAEAACLKALSIDPGLGSAQLTLAWVYLIGKVQPADAIHYFNEVLKRTQNPKIYLGLGMAYARNNERGRVLEIITLLRGKGEESLARQLEKMIRPTGDVPEQPANTIQASPSQIVKGSPEKFKPPVNDHGVAGSQKIQLRGKISFTPRQAVVSNPPTDENGEATDAEGHESSVQERMEKVRQMMGNRSSGRIRGTTNIQTSGSASGTVQVTPVPTQ